MDIGKADSLLAKAESLLRAGADAKAAQFWRLFTFLGSPSSVHVVERLVESPQLLRDKA